MDSKIITSASPASQPPPNQPDILQESDEILECAAKAAKAERTSIFGAADPAAVERLRNFLCYLLAVDYRCNSAAVTVRTGLSDQLHYRDAFQAIVRGATYIDTLGAAPSDDDRITLARLSWARINAPARALGIPPDVAHAAVARFDRNMNFAGAYTGCCRALIRWHGFAALAAKLVLDRDVVIPRVAPDAAFARALTDALDAVQRKYFVSLADYAYFVTRDRDNGVDGWVHGRADAIRLTAWSKEYQRRRMKMVHAKLDKEAEDGKRTHPFDPDGGEGVWAHEVRAQVAAPTRKEVDDCLGRLRWMSFWNRVGSFSASLWGFKAPAPASPPRPEVKGTEGLHYQAEVKNPDFLGDWVYADTEERDPLLGVPCE